MTRPAPTVTVPVELMARIAALSENPKAEHPHDVSYLIEEVTVLSAALATREEAPDWTARTEAAWTENNSEEAPAGSGIAYMAGLLAKAAVEASEEAPAGAGSVSSEADLKRIVKDLIAHRRAGDYDLMADDVANCLWPLLRAQPQAREDAQPVGWLRAVDEEMVCAHLGVAEAGDSYETAKKKLASLIQWNIAVAMDLSVGGEAQPVGEIVLSNKFGSGVSWLDGKLPPLGSKLYTHPAPDALSVEKLARGLAYIFAYKQVKKACQNPTASKEEWKSLASAKIDKDWQLFIPDATLLQEALSAPQTKQGAK